VVGGGILGLAAGRLLALEHRDATVTVLEKEPRIATHQSGHNSGVVHTGLYYEPGSLKARLCRRGASLLRDYCADHAIAYEACGKVLVATSTAELKRLEQIRERAVANGVPDVALLDADQLRAVEPHVQGIGALHSPHTAIVDYRAVCASLAEEIRGLGGAVRCETPVARVRDAPRPSVELRDGSSLVADRVIVCAGLQADRLARASGQPASPRIVPFRGEYWALSPERAGLVRGLVYPVPDPALPFLGVHLSKRIDGSVLIGPNAILTLARERYDRRLAVTLADARDVLGHRAAWQLFARHWRTGAEEVARSLSPHLFVRAAQRYVPDLRREDVVAAGAGVRAQAVEPDGSLLDDFRIGGGERVCWVRNAPSPAATSSLAIAEELLARLDLKTQRRASH
jgi:(S)-2-hydroxyglutarate dehydrogenase